MNNPLPPFLVNDGCHFSDIPLKYSSDHLHLCISNTYWMSSIMSNADIEFCLRKKVQEAKFGKLWLNVVLLTGVQFSLRGCRCYSRSLCWQTHSWCTTLISCSCLFRAGTLNSAVWLAGMKVNVVSLCKVRDKSTDSHMQVVRTERFKNNSYAGSGPEVHKETTLKGSSAVRWSHRNV